MSRIHIPGLAVSLGVTWGLLVLFTGWATMLFSPWCAELVEVFASVYIGFSATFLGGIIGFLWGFFDGAVAGILIALIYNAFLPKSRPNEG